MTDVTKRSSLDHRLIMMIFPTQKGQSEDRQDDLCHHLRLHPLLESLHRLRPPPGLRLHPGQLHQPRSRNLHTGTQFKHVVTPGYYYG